MEKIIIKNTSKIFLTNGITITFNEGNDVYYNHTKMTYRDIVDLIMKDNVSHLFVINVMLEDEKIMHTYYLPREKISWAVIEIEEVTENGN